MMVCNVVVVSFFGVLVYVFDSVKEIKELFDVLFGVVKYE